MCLNSKRQIRLGLSSGWFWLLCWCLMTVCILGNFYCGFKVIEINYKKLHFCYNLLNYQNNFNYNNQERLFGKQIL